MAKLAPIYSQRVETLEQFMEFREKIVAGETVEIYASHDEWEMLCKLLRLTRIRIEAKMSRPVDSDYGVCEFRKERKRVL